MTLKRAKSRVLDIQGKRDYRATSKIIPQAQKKGIKEVQQLLQQEVMLFISDDDFLYRKNKEQHQVVLPHALKEAVYRYLHINMAHIGTDRTFQLIRERCYWPKIEDKVSHFFNHQCPCVRQRKPHKQGKPPPLPTKSSAPLEIVGIDFLHLEKSS